MKYADRMPIMTDQETSEMQRVVAERVAAVLRSKPKPITRPAARKRRAKVV